jgi:hypothetical protein
MITFVFKWFKPIIIFFFDYSVSPPSFSTKKFFATVFSFMGIYDKVTLEIHPQKHWIVIFTQLSVSPSVIIAVEASVAGLVIGALTIYGWNKLQEKINGVQ